MRSSDFYVLFRIMDQFIVKCAAVKIFYWKTFTQRTGNLIKIRMRMAFVKKIN